MVQQQQQKKTGENPLTDPHVLVLPVVVDEEDRPVVRDDPPVHLRPANGDGERRLGVGLLAKVVLVVVVLGAVGDRAFESFFSFFETFAKWPWSWVFLITIFVRLFFQKSNLVPGPFGNLVNVSPWGKVSEKAPGKMAGEISIWHKK